MELKVGEKVLLRTNEGDFNATVVSLDGCQADQAIIEVDRGGENPAGLVETSKLTKV